MTHSDANRKYFDQISDTYDSKPWFAKTNELTTTELRNRLDWLGIPFVNTGTSSTAHEVRQLDYACGTGHLSRVYGPYVTVTRGIDVSPNMAATFNARARAAGLPENRIHAVVGDLLNKSNPSPPEFNVPEWYNFDLATVGFAFHHFEDVVFAAKSFKNRLRPGGVLLLTDFLEGGDLKADENGEPIPGTEGNHAEHSHGRHGHHHKHSDGTKHVQEHDHHHAHQHNRDHANDHSHDHTSKKDDPFRDPKVRKDMEASIVIPSFTVENVRKFLTEAGLVDVEVVTMKERVYMEFGGAKMWRTILFGKGRRPVEKSEL